MMRSVLTMYREEKTRHSATGRKDVTAATVGEIQQRAPESFWESESELE